MADKESAPLRLYIQDRMVDGLLTLREAETEYLRRTLSRTF